MKKGNLVYYYVKKKNEDGIMEWWIKEAKVEKPIITFETRKKGVHWIRNNNFETREGELIIMAHGENGKFSEKYVRDLSKEISEVKVELIGAARKAVEIKKVEVQPVKLEVPKPVKKVEKKETEIIVREKIKLEVLKPVKKVEKKETEIIVREKISFFWKLLLLLSIGLVIISIASIIERFGENANADLVDALVYSTLTVAAVVLLMLTYLFIKNAKPKKKKIKNKKN